MTDDSLLNPSRQNLTTRALRLADVLEDEGLPAAGSLVRELVAEIERLKGLAAEEEG